MNGGATTDTDSDKLDAIIEKLDKIIWRLDRFGEGLASMAGSVQALAATLREKTSPVPPPKPRKRP
jgi:hypothetical protein